MITGKMAILEMTTQQVIFRYDIDQTWPETIIMTVTRDRWEKEFKEQTRCHVKIEFESDLPKAEIRQVK